MDDGTAIMVGQTDKDCMKVVCDGAGMTKSINDNADTPDPMDSCHTGTCNAGTPGQQAKNTGAACNLTGGGAGKCNASAACVECLTSADCTNAAKPICNVSNVCVAATCTDNAQNGMETDKDCGGPVCGKCGDGKKCAMGSDCTSGVCGGSPLICKIATCSDGTQNHGESDVDCGAVCGAAKLCAKGKKCVNPTDCATGVCTNNLCDTLANGQVCTGGNQCTSTFCVTGGGMSVCCTSACNAPTSCNATNNTFTGAQACPVGAGMGTCNTPTAVSCGLYLCKLTGCPTTCTADADCTSTTYCDTMMGKCTAKVGTGMPCTQDKQCLNGTCQMVDGGMACN